MFFPRSSFLLSLNLFKKVSFSGSGDELPFASDDVLQFEFDDRELNRDNSTQGSKKLKDDYGAYADETQQEHKRGSDSEGDDQVINPIENRLPRDDRSLPIKINGSQNEIKPDSETYLNGNDFWKIYINEESQTDLSYNRAPNTKEGRTLSTSTEPDSVFS